MRINPVKLLQQVQKKLEEEKARIEELKQHPCYNCIFFNYEDKSCSCIHEVNRDSTPCYISISTTAEYFNSNKEKFNELKRG